MMLTQKLEAAKHCAQLARSDLQEALKSANAVEALHMINLISQAAGLEANIEILRSAIESTKAAQ